MRAAAPITAAVIVALLAGSPAAALSAGEVRARARQAAATGDEQRRVEQLAPLVLEFIELSDAAARSGAEAERRDQLRGAFEALHQPLDGIYTARSGQLDRMTRAVMDEDGDLEALYETPEFRQAQSVAAAALYYLNWLDYYGARLYEGERRTALLRAAEKGFSEFAVGERATELLTESQLGRGLCALELGAYDEALRDFRLVIDEPTVSPERKAKARLAVLDAYARAGRTGDVLRYSDELLRGGGVPASDLPLVRFHRLQALLDAAEKQKGAEAARHRQSAATLVEQLRRAGPAWAARADALLVSHLDNPAEWVGQAQSPAMKWELARRMLAKDDHAGATPLLEELVASSDAAAKSLQPEAFYWLGVARLKAGEPAGAAESLESALAGPPADWTQEARYLRFKALEAMMAAEPTPALSARYVAAIDELLANHPDHPMAAEARYRLAEYHQSTGAFDQAIEEYTRVDGDPTFALRARFGMLQSRFELLKTDRDPPARADRLAAIGHDLEAVREQAAALPAAQRENEPGVQELLAKTALLRAVYLSLGEDGGPEEVAASLADFSTRYPQQTELWPQAVRLRLGALLDLGRFADAEQAVRENAAVLAGENRPDALEALAASYEKAARRPAAATGTATPGTGGTPAEAARVALALYEIRDGTGADADLKHKLGRARLLEISGDSTGAAEVYRELLQDEAAAAVALRGLAAIEERQGRTQEALAHWVAYTGRTRPGDAGWYQGQYQQARLLLAGGDAEKSCELLTKLRPAMPGLTDAELRAQLNAVYEQACR